MFTLQRIEIVAHVFEKWQLYLFFSFLVTQNIEFSFLFWIYWLSMNIVRSILKIIQLRMHI